MRKLLLSLLCMMALTATAQNLVDTPLPPFSVTTTEGKVVTPEALPRGIPVIVFYFDPDCEHCQQQAQWVAERQDQFRDKILLWVSWGEVPDIERFRKQYFPDFAKMPNFLFTKDTRYEFDNWFGYSEVPSIYIYGSNGLRVKDYHHETSVDELLLYAR